jgi:hypothetical protein
MELALNLVWLLAATGLFGLWWAQPRRTGSSRMWELLAVATLVTILFPVVSVTDDLLVATSFAETDTTVRRDCDGIQPHSILSPGDALPESILHPVPLELSAGPVRIPVSAFHPVVRSFFDLANRPPPAA